MGWGVGWTDPIFPNKEFLGFMCATLVHVGRYLMYLLFTLSQLKHILGLVDQHACASTTFEYVQLCSEGKILLLCRHIRIVIELT